MGTGRRDGHIHVLPPETAKKIAAGEVIDRPAALVRELVDNALDAGAQSVEVALEGGGAVRTEVVDDGRGMEKSDLELSWLPHATSKILTEDDLLSVETLGFRGEALSSVSAVARLEITTCAEGGEAWTLAVGPGEAGASAPRVERSRRARGTSVRVFGLFDSFPARKKFLKRDGAEAALCKQALIDKALAFPEVSFRFIQDGELKLFLPSVTTRRERFSAALLRDAETPFTHEISASGEGFSLSIVVGGPELRRGDRRLQYVIANGRRIQDFGLQQALEYGVQGWFPNGSHPVGAVFVDIDPALADFNIHPAKREARFKDPQAIHSAATSALRDFMHRLGIATTVRSEERAVPETAEKTFNWGEGAFEKRVPYSLRPEASRAAMEALLDSPPEFAKAPRRADAATTPDASIRVREGSEDAATVRFIGIAFDLFLVAQRGERLFLIDQHAAHERLLYDKLRAKVPVRQELLVPYPFVTDSEDEDAFLASRRAELETLGISLEQDGSAGWQLTALPDTWQSQPGETVRELLDLRKAGADLIDRLYATMACRAAAKDGDFLDRTTAEALARAALALPIPRCPHGRPIWMEIALENLLRAVRRIE
ncbi:MAG: DNA mismatch repair endonuclease MutL [Treponemataceae bacterium]